jgi:hypothetical protein
MKRLLTLAAMFLCCVATTFAQFSGSGSGTENDPYLILEPRDLNQLRNFLNQEGVYFKLMADIDLEKFLKVENPSQGWQPVGTSSAPFKGVLDGNGKTVSGLWIDRPSLDYVGFFGNAEGAVVKNLTIEGISVKGKDYVGFLAGNGGSVSNCTFVGNVDGGSHVGGCIGCSGVFDNVISSVDVLSSGDYVGGLSGENGCFTNCKVQSNYIQGHDYVGGLCGSDKQFHNKISSCYVYTNITGNDYVGGVIGYKYDNSSIHEQPATIKNCGFVGDISASNNVGGICGYYYGGQRDAVEYGADGCYAIGHIIGIGNCIGGIIGLSSQYNYFSGKPNYNSYYYSHGIKDCYFSGSVIGKEQIGGIVGYMFTYVDYKISNCYSAASVAGDYSVGGLVGHIKYASSINSVGINTKVSSNGGNVARIIGNNEGKNSSYEDNKSYNQTIVIDQGVVKEINDDIENGTSVSATTLKLKATYVAMGWDFTDVWEIQESECYPYMKSQTAPPVITSQVVSGATTITGKCVNGGTVTLEVDGVKQQKVSFGHEFSFTVSPLQAGHEVRISAKAEGKEQSYYTTETVSYLGSGKENDPYQVYTASDLTGVYRKGYFKLMNDIDLTDYINQFSPTEGWESIGREGSETIHFDGNGHKITGLWCNSTRDNTGLFSCFANGTIKNLTVEVASGKQVKGGANTGILIGKMINGTIENCKVAGKVADGTPVGGMVGLFTDGSITRCQATVTITTTGATSYIGGLVGEMSGGTIDQCVTTGTLTATGTESYVGGLVGKNYSTITNCYSTANITSSYNAAGIVAYNYSLVDKCLYTGNLYSNNYAAGIIGYNDGENAVVQNCVATSNKIDVKFESQSAQSGGYGQRVIGGIKNNAPAPELNNYALKTMQVSVNNKPQPVNDNIMNGVGKSASDLLTASTYQELGWDFTDIWTIKENESYPALKNNVASVIAGDNTDDGSGVNTLSGVDLQTSAGSKVVLPINLNNENEVKLCQFDLQLPAGVTVATKSNGKLDAKLTERAETHTISSQQLSNGNYRFIISSMDNDSFTGNSGTLVEITLDIPATMEAGEYTVKLLNAELSVPDGNDLKVVKPADTESKLTIKAYTPGDVNNDGSVSVTDVGCAINYILEQVPSVFIFEAADMNGDKNISVTDVGMIINLILNEGAAASPKLNRAAAENTHLTQQRTAEGYQLQLENKDAFIGFQIDLQVAEGANVNGMKLIGSDDHLMTYRLLENGSYRVVCYSPTNSTFEGNEAGLLDISTTGDVTISNVRLTTADLNEIRLDAVSGGTTGIIDKLVNQNEELKVYTLDGRLCRVINKLSGESPMDGLKPGIYMIGNRKVVVR